MDNTKRCSRASRKIPRAGQEETEKEGATAGLLAPQNKLDPRQKDPL